MSWNISLASQFDEKSNFVDEYVNFAARYKYGYIHAGIPIRHHAHFISSIRMPHSLGVNYLFNPIKTCFVPFMDLTAYANKTSSFKPSIGFKITNGTFDIGASVGYYQGKIVHDLGISISFS